MVTWLEYINKHDYNVLIKSQYCMRTLTRYSPINYMNQCITK